MNPETQRQVFRSFCDLGVTVVTRGAELTDEDVAIIDRDPVTRQIREKRVERTVLERTQQAHTAIVPTRATYTRRSFKQAGEADITILGSALPFNPLVVQGVFVRLYMGLVSKVEDESRRADSEIRQDKNIRFVGYADQFEETHDDKGPAVVLKARDLSALFRDFKPVTGDAVPLYSDTLSKAIQKIISLVVERFIEAGEESPIELRPLEDGFDPLLSGAVHHRGATGPVRIDPNATAWAVLEHICGLVAATPYVENNELVVAHIPTIYERQDQSAYAFVFGEENANLMKVERTRKFARNRKGVRMVSYDPQTRAVIEAQWPPKGTLPPSHRPVTSLGNRVIRGQRTVRTTNKDGSKRVRTKAPDKDEYELLPAPPGITDQTRLLEVAKAAYLERRLGDLEGRLETVDLTDEVLGLHHADRITLHVKPSLEAEILNTTSDTRAVNFLARRLGMDQETAQVLVQATRQFPLAQYFVRSVSVECTNDGNSHCVVEFLKLTDASGGGL